MLTVNERMLEQAKLAIADLAMIADFTQCAPILLCTSHDRVSCPPSRKQEEVVLPCTYCDREMDERGTGSLLEWTDDHIMPLAAGP